MRQLNSDELSRVVGMGISSPELPKKQNSVPPVDKHVLSKDKKLLQSAV
ncbi:hypothetical protein [Pseudoalteromonas sp. MMG012]|nr:hypothetical protein [Pseudoalteromonas sp. MMG012]MBQ4852657.1 hypothetical protein [Pseudoalteromonas sp. MMG012]